SCETRRMRKWLELIYCTILVVIGTVRGLSAGPRQASNLELESSDSRLVEAFNWARQQAMAYVFDGDPVGPWYEAALPGRQAFCMRDVSHQSMGAQALGLAPYTQNMLRRFAENISESRDWCSYWEIDRLNRPAPVDYKNDAEFWYNLPANFDVLDSCYRMYLWTGDPAYVNDPVFLNFYERTMSDYVHRWSLGLDAVMKRRRWMNIRGEFDPHNKFQLYRGDPSYEEARANFVLGADLLATEYAAYRAYAQIQVVRENTGLATACLNKAASVKRLVNETWWNEGTHQFYAFLDQNGHFQGRSDADLLYRDVADDGPKAQSALNDLLDKIESHPSSAVEDESHYPEILYRYGAPEVAYAQIMDLTHEGRDRREYPEVSYSVVGAIVTGLMGIAVQASSPLEAAAQGNVEVVIKTLPGLTAQTAWAEIRNLPIGRNNVAVRHEGVRGTVFTNQDGPSLIWQATFPIAVATLLVDGKPVKANPGKEYLGRATSWVRAPVGAGDTVRVDVPKPDEKR
ncbi:MAG TPA: hypothetical protein VIX19_17345, partial [Terriglobales bacterium]